MYYLKHDKTRLTQVCFTSRDLFLLFIPALHNCPTVFVHHDFPYTSNAHRAKRNKYRETHKSLHVSGTSAPLCMSIPLSINPKLPVCWFPSLLLIQNKTFLRWTVVSIEYHYSKSFHEKQEIHSSSEFGFIFLLSQTNRGWLSHEDNVYKMVFQISLLLKPSHTTITVALNQAKG